MNHTPDYRQALAMYRELSPDRHRQKILDILEYLSDVTKYQNEKRDA